MLDMGALSQGAFIALDCVLCDPPPDKLPPSLTVCQPEYLPPIQRRRQAKEGAQPHGHEERAEHRYHGSEGQTPFGLHHVDFACGGERPRVTDIQPHAHTQKNLCPKACVGNDLALSVKILASEYPVLQLIPWPDLYSLGQGTIKT